ncbi:hypothetical protein [Anaerosporobacter faecicola]|uniref:hypothetical protein n=1 Tax=Anaerosporobacter faecicola TaxID=2718714 RepID=UPI0014396F5D|nr:hypothetical protein [Anaerosporobacter faecicola]
MVDKKRFDEVCDYIIHSTATREGIGTLSEKTLHAVLKNYYEPDENCQEIKIGAKVADILNETGVIEIQTKQFNKLRGKLSIFLADYPVTIVYPIARTKWLCWIDETTGEISPKRKSPKKGKAHQIFLELYKIKEFLTNSNLALRVVLVEVEEYRYLNGWSKDRKKGSHCSDRIPVGLDEEIVIACIGDYGKFIPKNLIEPFTSKDFAKEAKIPVGLSQVALNVMCSVGVIRYVGKQGRLKLYDTCEGVEKCYE